MTGYVWTTEPFAEFPQMMVWIVIAESPEQAVDKLLNKLAKHGKFEDAMLARMRISLSAVPPQILDLSDDVGLMIQGRVAVRL